MSRISESKLVVNPFDPCSQLLVNLTKKTLTCLFFHKQIRYKRAYDVRPSWLFQMEGLRQPQGLKEGVYDLTWHSIRFDFHSIRFDLTVYALDSVRFWRYTI